MSMDGQVRTQSESENSGPCQGHGDSAVRIPLCGISEIERISRMGMYEGRTAPSATYPESVVGIGAWAIAMLLIASSSVVPLF